MDYAIRISEHGGPEVLRREAIALAAPSEGEVLVRHTAIGVNFSDVYLRRGTVPAALPSGIGGEAVGVVEALGRGVKGLRAGQRVTYLLPVPGAYATRRLVPAEALMKVPDALSDEIVAATLMKGLTAEMLARRVHRLARGEVILVHAAAGGVGLLLAQWAKSLGVRVIGLVGRDEKRAIAQKAGCWKVLLSSGDWPAQVRALTKGRGVDVVYDGIGASTFAGSLDSLRPRGLLVSFGAASGPIPPFSIMELAKRGSLYVTRVMGGSYLSDAREREAAARALFLMLRARRLKAHIGQRYSLASAADAQRALESGATVGATILLP